MNIIETNKLYQTGKNYRMVRVKSPSFQDYEKKLRIFKSHLEHLEMLDQWQPVYRYYKRLNFICSSTLLPPLKVHEYLKKRISGLENIKRLYSLASNETRVCFDGLVESWKRIIALEKNPLRKAYEMHGKLCPTLFYNPEGRLNDMYQGYIEHMASEEDWALCSSSTATELKRAPVRDALVFTGSPRWAFMTDREHVLTAPRAEQVLMICFLHYEHELRTLTQLVTDESKIPVEVLDFRDESDVVPPESKTEYTLEHDLEDPTEFALPRLKLPNQADVDGEEDELRDYTDAYHVALTDDKGVWLGVDSSTRIIETKGFGLNAEATKCPAKKVRELSQGDVVIVTTGGAGDITEELANKILSVNHGWCREFQKRWKDELRSAIRRLGLELVVDHLKHLEKRLGAEHVYSNMNNIRNWCAPRNIRPESDITFSAILKYTSLEDEFEDFEKSARLIRQAHMKAGRQVAGQIRKSVKGASLSELFEKERQDFKLPELTTTACQTAFIVDRVDRNKQPVPTALVGVLHELDDLYE